MTKLVKLGDLPIYTDIIINSNMSDDEITHKLSVKYISTDVKK